MAWKPKYARSMWGWPPSSSAEVRRLLNDDLPYHAEPSQPASEHVASLAEVHAIFGNADDHPEPDKYAERDSDYASEAAETARDGLEGGRVRATRRRRERGCTVYIDMEQLIRAGLDPQDDPPYYVCRGYHRSPNGHSVIVSLYREP